jgi:xanthine dehydrogenase large subunit
MRKLIEQATFDTTPQGAAGKSHKHESAERQVSGQARYIDDMPEAANIHHVAVGVSPVTSGIIESIDLSQVKASEGVIDVITVHDIPGLSKQCKFSSSSHIKSQNSHFAYSSVFISCTS